MAKKQTGAKSGGKGAKLFRLLAPVKKPIQVKHLDAPLRYTRRERIHARRVLPRVKEGKERAFPSVTRAVAYHLQPVGRRATTDDLTLVTNAELTGPGQKQLASSVGEPSVSAANAVVMYSASSDTFVWLLQYGPKSGPEADNIQRLAFAQSADVAAGHWTLFDITTSSLGVGGQFMDFPDLAVGTNYLYVTTNLFTPDGQSAGAAVIRIPIASIGSGSPTAEKFLSQDLNSFRVAQNCGTTAFFAAHVDTSTFRVFSWNETDAAPTSTDIGVAKWIGGQGYQSQTPDGQRWLDRVDPRITGAAFAKNELWYAWSVDKGSGGLSNAFVQIAHIDASHLTLLENVNVFDVNSATAYGALSSNTDDEVRIAYMMGGPQQFPSVMAGILTGTRKDILVSAGERGTSDGQRGDYLTVRPIFPDRKLFAATGYTMKGAGDGSNRDATPRYIAFGRSGNAAPGVGGSGPDPGT